MFISKDLDIFADTHLYHSILTSKMKGRTIAFAISLSLAVGALPAKSLVLTLENGTLVYYLLGEDTNPMMRFVDGKVKVNADLYEFSGIRNFYISATDDPSGIGYAVKGTVGRYSNNMVIFDVGLPLLIKVYSLDGSGIDVCPKQVGGRTIVDLNPLPQGVYIVAVGDTALRIFKK